PLQPARVGEDRPGAPGADGDGPVGVLPGDHPTRNDAFDRLAETDLFEFGRLCASVQAGHLQKILDQAPQSFGTIPDQLCGPGIVEQLGSRYQAGHGSTQVVSDIGTESLLRADPGGKPIGKGVHGISQVADLIAAPAHYPPQGYRFAAVSHLASRARGQPEPA